MRAEPHHRGLPYAWTLHFRFQGTNFTVCQTLTLALSSSYISTKAFVVVGGDVNTDCNVVEKYTEGFFMLVAELLFCVH